MKRNEHPLYKRWCNMRQRCLSPTNPEFKNYGGRGITICSEWDDFWVYARDIEALGPIPVSETRNEWSLDRIKNGEGYKPGNMRWADQSTQQGNKRPYNRKRFPEGYKPREAPARSAKTVVVYEGQPLPMKKAAELLGCRMDTLQQRLRAMRKVVPDLKEIPLERLR